MAFGVYQSDRASVMHRKFTPTIRALQVDIARRLGRTVDIRLRIFKTYDDGVAALVKGDVDFARVGPASYIAAKRRNPKLRLLAMEHKNGSRRFQGFFIVLKERDIHKISDTTGRRSAFQRRHWA
jgi:phosphonate transport system substrate-binding protein